ncbi:MAG TPA: MDR family MFS transporter [Actinomycetales bacterium]|nr:MDR family MFS transporter [Actinomycetales bacterium]
MSTEAPTTAAAPGGVASAPVDSGGGLTHRQIVTILAGLMMGMFLAALDQTIVATAIRTIADDLNGLSVQAWVTTAYLITSTITTPLYGKLSDIYGRKPLFIAAISIFILGSLLCTFSTSMYMLAAFRAFQGIGAGGLFTLALAIIGDIVPPRERAKYQGYFLAVFGTSSVLGPVVGGFFAGADTILGITGWRWVFLVNVPIGFAALFVVNHTLNIEHHPRDHRIDWKGATALAIALVPLLTVAEQGRGWGWDSARSIACYAVGAAGLVLFFLAERAMGEEALIPLRLFKNRTVSVSTIANVVIGMGMFGGISVLPLYLQIVKGSSPTVAGLQLLPLTLGIMSGSVVSGQLISRTGRYKIFPVIGTTLMLVALLAFSRVTADTPLWQTMIVMLVFGYGLGNNMQPLVLAIQNAVSPRDIGVATASATFFRQIGGTLGVAIFLSILFSSLPGNLATAFREAQVTSAFRAALADPANAQTAQALRSGSLAGSSALNDSSFINEIDQRLAHPFLVGFAESMSLVFLSAAVVVAVGLVVVTFLPQVELRSQSGLEAAASERADAAALLQAEETGLPGPGYAGDSSNRLGERVGAVAGGGIGAGAAMEAAPSLRSTPAAGVSGNGGFNGVGNGASGDGVSSDRASSDRGSSDGIPSDRGSADGVRRGGRHQADVEPDRGSSPTYQGRHLA